MSLSAMSKIRLLSRCRRRIFFLDETVPLTRPLSSTKAYRGIRPLSDNSTGFVYTSRTFSRYQRLSCPVVAPPSRLASTTASSSASRPWSTSGSFAVANAAVEAAYDPSSLKRLRPVNAEAACLRSREIDDVGGEYFRCLFTPEFELVVDAFRRNGFSLRIVGGTVRDLLQGIRPYDLDLVTDATIDDVKLIFDDDRYHDDDNGNDNGRRGSRSGGGVKFAQTVLGDSHGSLKIRVNDKQEFEITSMRVDPALDGALLGRRDGAGAGVEWILDSSRRDFTVNSIYLTLDGTLHDHHGGEADLEARRVAFVGNPDDRIKEDFVRILRYFRFYGKISHRDAEMDPKILATIVSNVSGLKFVSPRRIWVELKKMVVGKKAAEVLTKMHELELLRPIGFPYTYSEQDMARFRDTCARTSGLRPHACTMLADFFDNDSQVARFADRLTLTRDEKNLLSFLVKHRNRRELPESLRDCEDLHSVKTFEDMIIADQWPPGRAIRVKEHVVELFKHRGYHHWILGDNWRSSIEGFKEWHPPLLPVSFYDVVQMGVSGSSHDWRELFHRLLDDWKKNSYRTSREELLEKLAEEMAQLQDSNTENGTDGSTQRLNGYTRKKSWTRHNVNFGSRMKRFSS